MNGSRRTPSLQTLLCLALVQFAGCYLSHERSVCDAGASERPDEASACVPPPPGYSPALCIAATGDTSVAYLVTLPSDTACSVADGRSLDAHVCVTRAVAEREDTAVRCGLLAGREVLHRGEALALTPADETVCRRVGSVAGEPWSPEEVDIQVPGTCGGRPWLRWSIELGCATPAGCRVARDGTAIRVDTLAVRPTDPAMCLETVRSMLCPLPDLSPGRYSVSVTGREPLSITVGAREGRYCSGGPIRCDDPFPQLPP